MKQEIDLQYEKIEDIIQELSKHKWKNAHLEIETDCSWEQIRACVISNTL